MIRSLTNETTSFDAGVGVATQCLPDVVDGYVTYKQFDTFSGQSRRIDSIPRLAHEGRITLIRALGICMAGASLLIGCVSVSGPSTQPSVDRSFGVTTPAPVASATAGATNNATQLPAATPTPTAEPTATPSVDATVAPTEPAKSPGTQTNDLVLFDDMDDPGTSGWGLTDTATTTVSMEDGALRISLREQNGAAYSAHLLGAEYAVVLVAADFKPTADGAVGVLCSTADDVHYGAAYTTNGALVFFSIEAGQVVVLDRINDVGSDLQVNVSALFGLECTGTATGALRLVAVLPEVGPIGVYQSDQGPSTFNAIAVSGEAFEQEFSVDVEQAGAYGIAGSADGMTPEGEQLLTHVPPDWQQTCTESPISEDGVAIIHCYLQVEGVGVELAQYQSFGSNELMDAAYQKAVDLYGVESSGSCESGPNETTWSIGDNTFGRLQCAPQQVGIRFDWTDDRLAVLSTLIDFDGDYQNTYQTWLEAGPNP